MWNQTLEGDRQAPREDVGDDGTNLLEGRTGVRDERDARGLMRQGNQNLPQDRFSARDGVGRPSRPESYHSATGAQKEEIILELERQVRELHREKEMRGPPPRMCLLPQPPWKTLESRVRLDK